MFFGSPPPMKKWHLSAQAPQRTQGSMKSRKGGYFFRRLVGMGLHGVVPRVHVPYSAVVVRQVPGGAQEHAGQVYHLAERNVDGQHADQEQVAEEQGIDRLGKRRPETG